MRWWFAQDKSNLVVNLEVALQDSYSQLSNLVYRGPRYSPQVTVPMKMIAAWKQVTLSLSNPNTVFLHTPLWSNPTLLHLNSVPGLQVWAQYNIRTLRHIMPEGRLLSFQSWGINLRFLPGCSSGICSTDMRFEFDPCYALGWIPPHSTKYR